MLDLIGALRHGYGRYCVEIELADPDNAEDIQGMVAYSPLPYGTGRCDYPAVILNAGATDPRCPPWHAQKFAARLQQVSKSSEPVLLHVWENSGHGLATGREEQCFTIYRLTGVCYASLGCRTFVIDGRLSYL